MTEFGRHLIRLCEWGTAPADHLSAGQRRQIHDAVLSWAEACKLPNLPLTFSGPDGTVLSARQYVGVVEVEDCTIEVFPKLDAAVVARESLPSSATTDTVMNNLLWMLEVCGYMDLTEADTAHLAETDVSFTDLFAYLMAKNLGLELGVGVLHDYVNTEDDLRAVRGRINILDQITRNWDRFDRISCRWDEFTPDVPLNRIFKCVCRVLQTRVRNPAALYLLDDCARTLEDVTDIDPLSALREATLLRWNRANDRFRSCFDMAVRLLAGVGYQLGHGTGETFVFLLDMNTLFETYVEAVLAAHFRVPIETQLPIGHLFEHPKRSIPQIPDFLWQADGCLWVGDAKYKHLAAGQADAGDEAVDPGQPVIKTSAADARQLTVYAEILRHNRSLPHPPPVAVLYPFIGPGALTPAVATAWNGSTFCLVPVQVKRVPDLARAVPAFSAVTCDAPASALDAGV